MITSCVLSLSNLNWGLAQDSLPDESKPLVKSLCEPSLKSLLWSPAVYQESFLVCMCHHWPFTKTIVQYYWSRGLKWNLKCTKLVISRTRILLLLGSCPWLVFIYNAVKAQKHLFCTVDVLSGKLFDSYTSLKKMLHVKSVFQSRHYKQEFFVINVA